MKLKACQAIAECLKAEKINIVFGYSGVAIAPLYDALCGAGIRHVNVRHEANSGHTASGYARISGKPAVCVATSGPGATNLLTSIATAYADSIPLIVITGQVSSDRLGRDVFQEANITGAAEPFVKHSYLINEACELPKIFKEAFYICKSGRPGPVLIDIPVDIQNDVIDFKYPKSIELRSYKPVQKGNASQVKRVSEALMNAKMPLLCVGGGVFTSNATDKVIELSHRMNIPAVSTMMGVSVFEADDSLNFGMIGENGNSVANTALMLCDVLLVIGARVGDRSITQPEVIADKTVIHIDIDPAEIGKNISANIPVVGDAGFVIEQILANAQPKEHKKWLDELSEIKANSSEASELTEFFKSLSNKLPSNTMLTADLKLDDLWLSACINCCNGRFLTSGGMGTIGYAIPAAIGAKLATPEKAAIAVCSDKAFEMSFAELSTAVECGADIKVIVISQAENNTTSPDYITLAQAYGLNAVRAYCEAEINEAIDKMLSADGTFLLELRMPQQKSDKQEVSM